MINTRGIAFYIVYFVVLLNAFACAEEPFSIYLTWQKSPETTMSIQWVTKGSSVDDLLLFQKKGDETWMKNEGRHQVMPDKLPYVIHYVELTDLSPDSDYYFRFGNEEKIYKFRTLPQELNRPLHFIVGGDMYHDTIDLLEKTNRAAAAKDPSFVIIGGDIAYSSSGRAPEKGKRWLEWLSVWNRTMISPEGYLIPIIPAIGNHEVQGGKGQIPREAKYFYTLFPLPGMYGYNVLDFGDYLSITLLDSGHTNLISGPQAKWLDCALSERTGFTHKFAVYHVPAYPSHKGFNDNQNSDIRKYWVPLFEKYGVNAVFENNEHTYKRSHPIWRGRVDPNGILYLGDGAWAVAKPRKPKTPKQAWYLAKSLSSQNFIEVTLDGSHRYYRAYNAEGVLIDEASQ